MNFSGNGAGYSHHAENSNTDRNATAILPTASNLPLTSVAGFENPPSFPNKIYDYIQGKGMSQSYIGSNNMPLGQTLLAEFLKKNVTIPPPPPNAPSTSTRTTRMVEEIDLTRDDRKRRDSRQSSKPTFNHQTTPGKVKPLPPRPNLLENMFPPLPVAPPQSSASQDKPPSTVTNAKTHGNTLRKQDLTKIPRKPLSPNGQQSVLSALANVPGRGKGLMSLPLPQPMNDCSDLISYSPTSPITPPQRKTTKKGIMDLPLPPGIDRREISAKNCLFSSV